MQPGADDRRSLGHKLLTLHKRIKSSASARLHSFNLDSLDNDSGDDIRTILSPRSVDEHGLLNRAPSDPSNSSSITTYSLWDTPTPKPAVPQKDVVDAEIVDGVDGDAPGLQRHKTVKRAINGMLGKAMDFNFKNSAINTNGGHVASHNVFSATFVQHDDSELMSHALFKKLPLATKAPYNNTSDQTLRRACTENTRTAILQALFSWSINPHSPRIYWLNGMAGTGKTTITYSFCQRLEHAGLLGASFFCSRRFDECAKLEYILPTIAMGLARRWPQYSEQLFEVVKRDQDVGNHSIIQQFTDLIRNPCLELVKASDRTDTELQRVIVIDALDECQDQTAVQSLLAIISRHALELPLKFFLTSRPEQTIRRGFALQEPDAYLKFLLHDVEKDLVSSDIELYLRESLVSLIEGRSDIDEHEEWPPPEELRILVNRADRLFIYAATACKFIGDGDDIYSRLYDMTTVSFSTDSNSADSSSLSSLDTLYTGILQRAYKGRTPRETEHLQHLLSAIVHIRDPLSIDGISCITGVQKVKTALSSLHSVVSVPTTAQDGRVSVFHASFPDYLSDVTRSNGFYQSPEVGHRFLADRCLGYLSGVLKENICNLPDRTENRNVDVSSASFPITEPIRYACLYWAAHVVASKAEDNQELDDLLRRFFWKHLLHWFECLSLIGRLDVAVDSLRKLESWTKSEDLRVTSADARRFVQHSLLIINKSCLEVYRAAIIFAPTRSITRKNYFNSSLPTFLLGKKDNWDLCEQVIPFAKVRCLDLSPDNRFIAIASDRTISLQDGTTHSQIFSLQGHITRVETVSFSQDGKQIASAATDQTIKIWDTRNGELERTYRVPDVPTSLAFTPDGQSLIFNLRTQARAIDLRKAGQEDFESRMERVFAGHDKFVNAVAISRDGTLLATASDDGTARTWRLNHGHCEHVFQGHEKALTDVVFVCESAESYAVRHKQNIVFG